MAIILDEVRAESLTTLTRERRAEVVGEHDLRWCGTDEAGREHAYVEYSDARQGWLRAELDGRVLGPVSELYLLPD